MPKTPNTASTSPSPLPQQPPPESEARRPNSKITPLGHEINVLFEKKPKVAIDKLIYNFLRPPRATPSPSAAKLLATAHTTTLLICSVAIKVYIFDDPSPASAQNPTSTARKKTVLLTHGQGTSAASMLSFASSFVAAGCKVVMWDHGGHGASGGERSDLTLYRESFLTLAREHAPVEALVGHSAGATMALWGLVEEKRKKQKREEGGQGKGGGEAGLVKKVVCLGAPTRMESIMDRFCAVLGLEKGRGIEEKAIREMGESGLTMPSGIRKVVATERSRADGGKIDVGKVLVVQDRDDRVVLMDDAEWLAESFANSTLEITSGLGHFRGLSDQRVVALVTAFVLNDATASSRL